MTDKTWVGGGNNRADNPNDWTPAGAPQSGDNLLLPGGSTINITDSDLQGNPLVLSSASGTFPTSISTVNLSQHAHVTLENQRLASSDIVVNVRGTDFLNLSSAEVPQALSATVNLADHARLFGNLNLLGSTLTVSAGNHAKYINDGTDVLRGATATINADVVGSGTFQLTYGGFSPGSIRGSSLEFGGFVSSRQIVDVTGIYNPYALGDRVSTVIIDDPAAFRGLVDLHAFSVADLVGLVGANTWSYDNDLLSIYNAHGRVIDKLRVASDDPAGNPAGGLSVTRSATGDLLVSPGSDFHGSLAMLAT